MFLPMSYKIAKASLMTITVDDDGPADFHTIQEAINNASSGSTIFVHKGTYYEHVVVNKSLSLVGENMDLTIVDGRGTGKVIVVNASGVSIHGFTVRNSGALDSGILVDGSIGNNISHNIIEYTNGISLYYSGNNLISSNIIISNYYNGIYLLSSSNNVISNNNITFNYDGIRLQSSSNNVISGNTMFSNFRCGIYIDYSSNNTIYHNNFDNLENVLILQSGMKNAWDYTNEGNYWNNYAGHDLNGDGIGDSSYDIDPQNQDKHPLMGMFSIFNITFESETYSVTTISNSTISFFRFELGTETGNKIIRFIASGADGTVGFCRVTVPTGLMLPPYIVSIDGEEIIPESLNVSNGAHVCLYFTYLNKNQTITIIYSETLHLYNELLEEHLKLQSDFYRLNSTYYALLNNYSLLLGNFSQTQEHYDALNKSYYELYNLNTNLNVTYSALLNNYDALLESLSLLQERFSELNMSYQEHLQDYCEQTQNIRNLLYIFSAITALFLITTIYLSKRVHTGRTVKTKISE